MRTTDVSNSFNYTDAVARLIADIATRVEGLRHINPARVLAFASIAKTASSAWSLMACHCLCEPQLADAGSHKAASRRLRDEGSTYRMPTVTINGQDQDYMLSVALPWFCDLMPRESLSSAYPEVGPWVVKLEALIHLLYAISPTGSGFRESSPSRTSFEFSRKWRRLEHHDPVTALVRGYLDTGPSDDVIGFLCSQSSEMLARYTTVVATVFKMVPQYPRPQRRWLRSGAASMRQWDFTEQDLVVQAFPLDLAAEARERHRSRYFKGQPREELTAQVREAKLRAEQREEEQFLEEEVYELETKLWKAIELLNQHGLARNEPWIRRWIDDGYLEARPRRRKGSAK